MEKKHSLRSFFKSLKFRIFLLTFLVGTIPCALICLSMYFSYEASSREDVLISMTSQSQMLSNQIISSGYLTNTDNDTVNTQIDAVASANSARILVLNDSLTVVKDTYTLYEGKTVLWNMVISAARGYTTTDTYSTQQFITTAMPISEGVSDDGEASEIYGVLVFIASTDSLQQSYSQYISYMIFFLLVDAIISFFLAWIGAAHSTRSYATMAMQLQNMERGLQEGQLKISSPTEAALIAERFNQYTDKMKKIDDSRQEFVSNVSHELKTPLTSMKVLADSIASMPDAPVELYKEFMDDIGNEIERETKIINDLLSLVKMDRSNAEMNVAPININELVEGIMKRLGPIADEKGVELVLESFRPITVEVDEVKFSLAITNLIENGIKYNNEGGWVHVSLNADHQNCFIHVEDNGLGIPEDSVDHVFERFYRADKSHSTQIKGTGLGLSITHNVVVLHHGEIKVRSVLGEGTKFAMRIPLNYIAKEVEA